MGRKIWMDARPLLENSTACQKSMPYVIASGSGPPFGGLGVGGGDMVETNVMSVDVMHLIEAR
jgi:hypothetical protein